MHPFLDTLLRLLAPPSCVFCGRPLADGRLCGGCRDDLPWNRDACPRCAAPLAAVHAAGVPCAACQRQAPPWELCVAPLNYRFPVDSALKALKFRHRLEYAPMFAALLAPLLAERLPEVDALVPVPLHRLRQARRGYNQAVELCRPLARARGLEVVTSVRRVRATRAQAGLDRAARRRNLRGAFRVHGVPRCRYALIVDDVMTTGETCRQLALALKDAGVARVAVLTVARAASEVYAGENV